MLQTQQRAHTSAWTLLHPASGSTEPVLSLKLGRNITVYQGSGPHRKALTQLKKLKVFSSKRAFQHAGQTYCWRREALKQRHEEFRCGSGSAAAAVGLLAGLRHLCLLAGAHATCQCRCWS